MWLPAYLIIFNYTYVTLSFPTHLIMTVTAPKIRIAIAEDQPKLLKTLREALQFFEEVEVAFEAINGKELLQKLMQSVRLPEVILMDIEMPIINGIEATQQVKANYPDINILMLTVFDDAEQIFQAILAGASGYLLKGERVTKIVQAIQDVQEGRLPMSPDIAGKALQLMRSIPASEKTPQDFGLTKREVEILEYIAQAWSYQKIADKLFISPSTVRNHIHKIYSKIHVSSKAEAVQLVMKHQWFK